MIVDIPTICERFFFMGLSCGSILNGTLALQSIGEYILYDYVYLLKGMSDDRSYLFPNAFICVMWSHF